MNENLSNRKECKKIILDYLNIFLKTPPTKGRAKEFKSFLILLPEVAAEDAEEVIENVQKELKPYFTSVGLMIGQFYPQCDSPGIRNPEFRPLRSPIPMLVLRYMVKTDYVFLEDYQEDYFNNFKHNYDPRAVDFFSKVY